jgi:phytoene/squalene synthetase
MSGAGSHFIIAFRVLSTEQRRGMHAVYSWCRMADDAADDTPDPNAGRAALGRVRAIAEAALAGRTVEGAGAELAWAVERFELPRRPFELMLEGVGWDLAGRRYPTRQALREYAYRVASSVGLLSVRIFGCEKNAADRYAEETGIGLQWINILRDVGADLVRGRVYLPDEILERHGLDPEALRRGDPADRGRLAALIHEEAAWARERLAAARRSLPGRERPRVLAGEIMASVYEDLLRRVERAGGDVLDHAPRLPGWRRAWVAVRARARGVPAPAEAATP